MAEGNAQPTNMPEEPPQAQPEGVFVNQQHEYPGIKLEELPKPEPKEEPPAPQPEEIPLPPSDSSVSVRSSAVPEVPRGETTTKSERLRKMFGFFSSESLRGPGMIILQVLRGLTIIGLAAAVTACWILIIKINTSNGFFFFDAASLFFTSTIAVFLAISELPVAKSYFRRTWPVLSDECGLTWLGLAMVLIGCNILGKLNQPNNAADKIGLPFWRLVLASGILAITFGMLNILLSFVFKDSENEINARMVRSQGSLTKSPKADCYSSPSNSIRNEKAQSKFRSIFWKKPSTGKQVERPQISHPLPAHYDIERDGGNDGAWNYNSHGRDSPKSPDLERPDTLLHPIYSKGYHGSRPRSSHYSTAQMSRF